MNFELQTGVFVKGILLWYLLAFYASFSLNLPTSIFLEFTLFFLKEEQLFFISLLSTLIDIVRHLSDQVSGAGE